MFVQIQKKDQEDKILRVPMSTFKNFYQGAGWMLVKESKTSKKGQKEQNKMHSDRKQEQARVQVDDKVDDESDDDDWGDYDGDDDDDELATKPLSEMTHDELVARAAALDVNLAGLTKDHQIREAIKSKMK